MFISLLCFNEIAGKSLADNLLVPFGILLLIIIINRASRALSALTGIDIIATVLVLKYYYPESMIFDSSLIYVIKTFLLVYFSFRVGLNSKKIFSNINDTILLKYSLFDLFLSISIFFSTFYLISYLFLPIVLENDFNGILLILILSFIFSIGSKSLFKNFYAQQIEKKELFDIPFSLIDIHQLFIFILSASFILFFNDHTKFFEFNQSETIYISLGIAVVISTIFGLLLNKFEKKRELNLALLSFSLMLSGLLIYFNFSPMFIPFFIGLIVSYFINNSTSYNYLTSDTKGIVSSSLLLIFVLDIDIIYQINFYTLAFILILLRFVFKFLIQKLSTFYFDNERLAIPGIQMLFLGQGKTSIIILLYFSFSFEHIYMNELKIIIILSVLIFELIGILRSKPEHIISNKTMMKEIDT